MKEEIRINEPANSLSDDEIRRQLQRILGSVDFTVSDNLREFLRYIIDETLAGRSKSINAYAIAVHVFQRGSDFDPSRDPIVRIQAGKLRRSLERYFFTAGTQDPIRIDIPKGAYIPTFVRAPSPLVQQTEQTTLHKPSGFESPDKPAIGLLPIDNLIENRALDGFVRGLLDDLSLELSRARQFRVINCQIPSTLSDSNDNQWTACVGLGVDYLLGGSVRQESSMLKVVLWLAYTRTGEHLWEEQYKEDISLSSPMAFQEKISRTFVSGIAGEYGLVARIMSDNLDDSIEETVSINDAVLHYYRFDRIRTIETWLNARKALKFIVDHKKTRRGLPWSLMAQLDIASFVMDGYYGTPSMERALAYAQKGVALSPQNQIVREILAWTFFCMDDLDSCMAELEKALQLNPHSAYQFGVIGWDLCLCGDWDRGLALLKEAMELNPHYPEWWHFALFLYHFSMEKYDQAYQETLRIDLPTIFWSPLIRASALGMAGQTEQAQAEAKNLLKIKPEFKDEGKRIIQLLIKEEALVAKIVEGLHKGGITLT